MKFWAKLPGGFFGGNIAGTFEGILPSSLKINREEPEKFSYFI